MNYKTDIKPISYIKSHAADILKQINETHRPIIITQNGIAKGVFVDTETYENTQKSLQILKLISFGEKDIENGNIQNMEDVFEELDKKFGYE